MGEMNLMVAIRAKADQVFGGIIAERTARTNTVYLKAFPRFRNVGIASHLALGHRCEACDRNLG
jgi:hypothetical protein